MIGFDIRFPQEFIEIYVGLEQGSDVRFRLDCGVIFVVDFSELNDIRNFSRDLLGFLRVGEWERSGLGLDYCVFQGGVGGEFYVDFVGVCPKRCVEQELGIEVDFGTCEQSGTTMGNQGNMTKLLNVNIPPYYCISSRSATIANFQAVASP